MSRHKHGGERPGRLRIVVVGGGIVGCTAAYYLTRHPSYSPADHDITVLESTRLAAGASGKAGGLLAQWAYPASLVPLSFALHQELATEHDGFRAWGYRTIRCGKLTARDARLGGGDGKDDDAAPLSWAAQLAAWVPLGKRREVNKDARNLTAVEVPEDLDWFRRDTVCKYEDIAPQKETAQVHPHQFTLAMASLAEEKGARIVTGAAVDDIEYVPGEPSCELDGLPAAQKVRSVRYADKATGQHVTLAADIVILAAGPWTPDLFPDVPMSALRAHSVTIKPTRRLSAYCLFSEISMPLSKDVSTLSDEKDTVSDTDREPSSLGVRVVAPEIYSRPNNEVYIAGEGDAQVPLPASADDVEVDRQACRVIEDAVRGVSDELRDGIVTGRRACYLPTVNLPSGNPLIGPTWIEGLLLATGHGCWGIHNAPATGKLISEMVFEGAAKSADISALDPRVLI